MALIGLIGRGPLGWDGLLADARRVDAQSKLEGIRAPALEIGVQRSLGKPYQEPELMRNVFELLGTGPEYSHEQ